MQSIEDSRETGEALRTRSSRSRPVHGGRSPVFQTESNFRTRSCVNIVRAFALSHCGQLSSNDPTGLGIVMDTESQKLLVQPTGKRSSCGKSFSAQRPARRWRFSRRETLLSALGLAFLCLMFVVLANFIHPAPDRVTKQQDAAELARVEAQTLVDNGRSAVPGPARISNVDDGRTTSKAKDYSESESRQPGSIARRNGSVDKTVDSASSESKEEPRTIKSYRQRQRLRDLQRQQAVDSSRQRYAQQESGSFLRAIRRLLGFPTQ